MTSRDRPITLAFVGYAPAATAERATAYEDAVLKLLDDHGARLLFRGRRRRDQDDSLPLEIHLIAFPSRRELDALRTDERRRRLLAEYGNVFTLTHSVELESIEPLTQPCPSDECA